MDLVFTVGRYVMIGLIPGFLLVPKSEDVGRIAIGSVSIEGNISRITEADDQLP